MLFARQMRIFLSLAPLLLASGVVATPPSFRIIGSLNAEFFPDCLSGNGRRVVGEYYNISTNSYDSSYVDWQSSLTPVSLGATNISPKACSFDGSVIVGTGFTTMTQPFRWNSGTLTYIAPPPGAGFGIARAITADGATFVGQSFLPGGSNYTAARWNASTGWTFLPALATASCQDSVAVGISASGNIIAGAARHCHDTDTEIDYEAAKWDPSLGALGWYIDLFGTQAEAISADGSTIVGRRVVRTGSGSQAVKLYAPARWRGGQIELLAQGLLFAYASAHDVSADGSVIVGFYGDGPFIWKSATGLLNLNTFATNLVGSAALDGWTLTDATAISDDGRVIMGRVQKQDRFTTFILDLGSCTADFNSDNIVDLFDYLDFVQSFSSGETRADFNGDHIVDFFDYLDFVQAFAIGC